jgi:hypothetical protein
VDPRAGLDEIEKRKFLTLPGLEHRAVKLFVYILTATRQSNRDIQKSVELYYSLTG